MNPSPNPGKSLAIETPFGVFLRIPIRTHVVMPNESLDALLRRYAADAVRPGDLLFLSEKIVAITQGRAFKVEDIRPSALARLLSRFVRRTKHGIGLAMPETMQLALEDVGAPRLLLAAFCSALTKPFGIRGVFYRVAGSKARAVDGPCDCTIPPFNRYAKKAPENPDAVARHLASLLGCDVVIIDANDLGVNVLGKSNPALRDAFCCAVFADNPLGQGAQSTPIAIVRAAENADASGTEKRVS